MGLVSGSQIWWFKTWYLHCIPYESGWFHNQPGSYSAPFTSIYLTAISPDARNTQTLQPSCPRTRKPISKRRGESHKQQVGLRNLFTPFSCVNLPSCPPKIHHLKPSNNQQHFIKHPNSMKSPSSFHLGWPGSKRATHQTLLKNFFRTSTEVMPMILYPAVRQCHDRRKPPWTSLPTVEAMELYYIHQVL